MAVSIRHQSAGSVVFCHFVSAVASGQWLYIRDDHGNGIPNGNGNPMEFPWEWELVTK